MAQKYPQTEETKEDSLNLNPEFKDISLSLSIQDHDMQHKAKLVVGLLEKVYKGTNRPRYRIRLVIKLRGRNQTHADLVPAKFAKFLEFCKDAAEQDGNLVHRDGSDVWMIMLRKRKKGK